LRARVKSHLRQSSPKIRDWVWRGWQIRYLVARPDGETSPKHPPLILLHGFGAAIGHWRYNIPALSETHVVYALDLLGFGASRKPPTYYQVDLWAEQVYDFWHTFIRHPAHLVGNSIGSLVCLAAAVNRPEMVKSMTLISLPDVSLRQEAIPKWLQPLVSKIEAIFANPLLLRPLFYILRRPKVLRRWAGIAYANPHKIDDELVEILATPTYDEGAARAFCALCQAVSRPNFSPPAKAVLPELKIPILLIWGRQDRMVPASLAPTFAALNPQIKLVELDNAGHCPQDECPTEFNSLLLGWLETRSVLESQPSTSIELTQKPGF